MPQDGDITVVITSCNRHDLLARTLESFRAHGSEGRVARILVAEDGDADPGPVCARFGAEYFRTGARVGQTRLIDQAYAKITTPYIFHLEDDWEFYRSGFMERSRALLEADPLTLLVSLRAWNDTNGWPLSFRAPDGSWGVLAHGYQGVWHNFTFNPGLRRLSDYRLLGSYAGQKLTLNIEPRVATAALPYEAEANKFYYALGYRTMILNETGFIRHTGWERHVTHPDDAKSLPANLSRNRPCPCGSGKRIQALPWRGGIGKKGPAEGVYGRAEPMTCFGMVTTARSHPYTVPALASFFRNTDLAPEDRILLIDNDGDFDPPTSLPRVELIRHDRPHSFAANVNLVIQQALKDKGDVVFLNNDMIFTRKWLEPLCATDTAILIPMCNQHLLYNQDGLQLRTTMIWQDYAGHENTLEKVAAAHRGNPEFRGQYWRPQRISFYCFRLPFAVHASIGLFDEGFGVGGGEDVDYRLRALAAGFDAAIALESYVLHFMGKSTWDSGETEKETRARDEIYIRHFGYKWGDDLMRLFLFCDDGQDYAAKLGVETMMKAGDYRGVISHCMARREFFPRR